jgi:hypothetical protein
MCCMHVVHVVYVYGSGYGIYLNLLADNDLAWPLQAKNPNDIPVFLPLYPDIAPLGPKLALSLNLASAHLNLLRHCPHGHLESHKSSSIGKRTPDQRRTQTTREPSPSLPGEGLAGTIDHAGVLAFGRVESVGLDFGLDYVYWVDTVDQR